MTNPNLKSYILGEARKLATKPAWIIPDGTTYYFGYIVSGDDIDLTADIWKIKRIRVVGAAYEFTWAERGLENLVFDSGAEEYKTSYNYF